MAGGAGTAIHFTRSWRKARSSAGPSRSKGRHVAFLGSKGIGRAAALCWACISAAPASAGNLDYTLGVSTIYDTNITRSETNPAPELTGTLRVEGFYDERTADVTARASGWVEKRHFYNHTFSDDTQGYLDAVAVGTILPRRFTWFLEDQFRQLLVNITAPDTPDNRTKSNSLSTGPDFIFAADPANSVMIGGRYGRYDVQNSVSDNRRYEGYLRGIHSTSPQSKLSLNYLVGRVFFDPDVTPVPEVLREDWFVRYETLSEIGGGGIDIGKSRVIRYTEPPLDGHILRVALTQQLSRQSTVRAAYSDVISDTYSDLVRGIADSTAPAEETVPIATSINLATADLYHSKRGELGYACRTGSFDCALSLIGRKVDFVTLVEQNYTQRGQRFSLNWYYSGNIRFNAYADYSKFDYPNLDRVDVNRAFAVGMDLRVNRNLVFSVLGGSAKRDSSAPGGSYVDNRLMLRLVYGSGRFQVLPER